MNWKSRNRATAIAGATLLLVMMPFAPVKVWACTVSGSQSFAVNSEIDEDSVTICVKEVTRKVVKPVAPPKVAPPVKVIRKPTVVTKPNPVTALPKPTPSQKPAAKPSAPKPLASKPQATPKPKASPIVAMPRVTSSASSAEMRFTPAALVVRASATEIRVDQAVNFSADAFLHFKTSSLLGKATEVRFTPISINWLLANGGVASGQSITSRFDHLGKFVVIARARYAVAYRLSGESQWLESGEIVVAGSVSISVSDDYPKPTPTATRVLLVANNCQSNPTAFGCGG